MNDSEKLKVARESLARLKANSYPVNCVKYISAKALATIDAPSAEQPDLHSIRLETAKQEIKYWKAKATAPSAEQPADVPEVARARAEEVAELAAQLVTMTAERDDWRDSRLSAQKTIEAQLARPSDAEVEALTACAHLLNMPAGAQITDAPKYLAQQMVRAADLAGIGRFAWLELDEQIGARANGEFLLFDDVQALLSKHAGQCVSAG